MAWSETDSFCQKHSLYNRVLFELGWNTESELTSSLWSIPRMLQPHRPLEHKRLSQLRDTASSR